jgi:hypothetical protein
VLGEEIQFIPEIFGNGRKGRIITGDIDNALQQALERLGIHWSRGEELIEQLRLSGAKRQGDAREQIAIFEALQLQDDAAPRI